MQTDNTNVDLNNNETSSNNINDNINDNINNKKTNDIENNRSIIKLKQNTNTNNDNIKSELKINDNSSNISKNESDNQSIFNEENQNLSFFSYLIHKITFHKTYEKYNIYEEFREKIFNDEQMIRNHMILYNLTNKNKATSTIYSLKEIINDEK